MRRRLAIIVAATAALGGLASVAPASAQRDIQCVRDCSPVPEKVREAIEDLTTCPYDGGLCLPPL